MPERFYWVGEDTEDNELYISYITVNEYHNKKAIFSNYDATPAGAINRYRQELFEEFNRRLCQLHELERSAQQC